MTTKTNSYDHLSFRTDLYLGGEWISRGEKIVVINPWDGQEFVAVSSASKEDFLTAIESARAAFAFTKVLPSYKREAACLQIAAGIEGQIDRFAETMTRELGKAIKDSRTEVLRAIAIFRTAAEESKRIGGELIDLDWMAGHENRFGIARRFPRGVIAGISPFNFPLMLVAHKIAPAIASGNCMVLKPASKTPLSALLLAELIDDCDYPKGAISILPASSDNALPLIEDERIKLITFTGSSDVGWWIEGQARRKPVVLELGGNAGVIVADDADIEYAAGRIVTGAYGVAGQSCISVQRLFVHEKVQEALVSRITERIAKLKIGDPMDPTTDIGTMVDMNAASKAKTAVDSAVQQGAIVLLGGNIAGKTLQPTLLGTVTPSMEVCRSEMFAPIATVETYTNIHNAVARLNASRYGLQAGLFTNRMSDIWYAYSAIECGGVVINDIPTYRADHQPYGGMKESGMGREGVRYAIEDMTEVKFLSINNR
ncbi:MAG: aldehyde dehydrogenase family protein [Candidatus Zixiibacteriota bacterium]